MFDPGLMDMVLRLRGRGVSENPILRAFETVPRKHFVDPQHYLSAYDEKRLPINCGQIISEPLTIARLTQALDVETEHKVLEIGTGSGYHAALLSRLCKRVYSVERYLALVKNCEALMKELNFTNIIIRHGDGRYGWRGQAPFDRILVTVGLRTVPDGLLDQLKRGGKLVAVVDGELTVFEKQARKISETVMLPMELPMIEAGKSKVL